MFPEWYSEGLFFDLSVGESYLSLVKILINYLRYHKSTITFDVFKYSAINLLTSDLTFGIKTQNVR